MTLRFTVGNAGSNGWENKGLRILIMTYSAAGTRNKTPSDHTLQPQKLTGMTKSISDLGTREIHDRHSVMIEGGIIPRAKVMDQLIVDKLLMDGRITLSQHMAAELFLSQAERACINIRAQKYDAIPAGNGKKDNFSNGYGAFSKTVTLVKKGLGVEYAMVLYDCLISNELAENNFSLLTDSLDLIVNRRM